MLKENDNLKLEVKSLRSTVASKSTKSSQN